MFSPLVLLLSLVPLLSGGPAHNNQNVQDIASVMRSSMKEENCVCKSPLGLIGDVRFDGCTKFVCEQDGWIESSARELCCSYLDNWYQPGQIISSFLSSDNCTIVTLMCQVGPSISGEASTHSDCTKSCDSHVLKTILEQMSNLRCMAKQLGASPCPSNTTTMPSTPSIKPSTKPTTMTTTTTTTTTTTITTTTTTSTTTTTTSTTTTMTTTTTTTMTTTTTTTTTTTSPSTTTPCPELICDPHASFLTNYRLPCGYCRCHPGWVGPGHLCGPDNDSDGWSDVSLECEETSCAQDNCVGYPNSGQEDADGDGEGDACDSDSDNDGIKDDMDNCPLHLNPEQADSDEDFVGDACDNCLKNPNRYQEDVDNDSIGDVCDDDMDDDGIPNVDDNCPFFPNAKQSDMDQDNVGDDCDDCPDVPNPNQEDVNQNGVGDSCDDGTDSDQDGVPDSADNCPATANADQLDSDYDGQGDECDKDRDNDGIQDSADNCPYVVNSDQADANNNGVGDVCENDCDGDSVMDEEDACPCNNDIVRTDFRGLMPVSLTTSSNAVWEFRDEGKEIVQKINSSPEVAVGKTRLSAMEFEGTMFVTANWDNDWIGSVFSFQDTSNFYLFMSSKAKSNQGPWQIKRVSSITGSGSWEMTNAIIRDVSVANQTEVLWKASGTGSGQEEEEALSSHDGWNYDTSYRFHITHLPDQGIIRLKLYEGATLLHDSGDIIDNGEQALRGGRMGVFCNSQQDITWSALSYRCL